MGTKVILTSENDLESIPSFFVFWKNLEAVGVNSERVYYLQTERSKMIIKNRFLKNRKKIKLRREWLRGFGRPLLGLTKITLAIIVQPIYEHAYDNFDIGFLMWC